jgi:hypothetical protein
MTDQGTFQISQGLEVLRPRSGRAYPIPCNEWEALKSRISKLTSEPWFFQMAGSLFLGSAITVFIAIFLDTYSCPEQQRALYTAWGVVAATTLSGSLCLLFAHRERGAQRERATDVVAQMDLIEERFDMDDRTQTGR